MPLTLDPIPIGEQITDQQGGITLFFRLRWEALRARFSLTPTVASIAFSGATAISAPLVTTTLYTTLNAGLYRISTYVRIAVADGVASAIQVTIGWTESSLALTALGTNLIGDTTGTLDTKSYLLQVDAPTNLTIAASYSSNTPNKMKANLFATVEQIG